METLFVIDNSVVMSWCFKDEANAYADSILENLKTGRAIVPAIWPFEVANVLLVAERRKRLTQAASIHFLSLLMQLPITVEQESPLNAIQDLLFLGREVDLSSYDLSYLDLAMRKGCSLATLDQKLTQAAPLVGVPLTKQ